MLKGRPIRKAMKEQGSFVGKDDLVGALADGQQLILHIVGKNVLSLNDSMNFIFSAQFIKHGFGDAVRYGSFRFDNAAMVLSNGGKLGHVIHFNHLTIPIQRYYRQFRYQSQQCRRTFAMKFVAISLSK